MGLASLASGCGGARSAKPLNLKGIIVFQRQGKAPAGACFSTCPEDTYVVRPGNQEVKLGASLTFAQQLRYFGSWSRDRRRAVMLGCSGRCIQTFDLAVRGRRVIRRCGGQNRCYAAPAISPDGSIIAFLDTRGDPSISVVQFDGAGVRSIVYHYPPGGVGSASVACPVFSPNGAWIAYQDNLGVIKHPGQSEEDGSSIRVVHPDGKGDRAVTHWRAGFTDGCPVWAPDEQILAYSESAPPGTDKDFHIYEIAVAEGAKAKLLTDVPGDRPTYSPNGRAIAFVRFYPDHRDIEVAVGSKLYRVTNPGERGVDGDPAWVR